MDDDQYHRITSMLIFILSATMNSLFIFTIQAKPRQNIGNYKHLMTCFAISDITFALLGFISAPIIYAVIVTSLISTKLYDTTLKNKDAFDFGSNVGGIDLEAFK
ncbi:hypothetical protein OSTOST_07247, partial [Ostertagia ostertagi]